MPDNALYIVRREPCSEIVKRSRDRLFAESFSIMRNELMQRAAFGVPLNLWFQDGKLFKRRELRKGEARPADFLLADRDGETGKTVGWVSVTDGAEDKWHREAF